MSGIVVVNQVLADIVSPDGYSAVWDDGYILPSPLVSGVLVAGRNSNTLNIFNVDSLGRVSVVGSGVAGTPSGGVLSVQGVAGGTALPVSGTFFQSVQPVSQNGTWTIRNLDGYGAPLLVLNTNPLGTENGLVVRNIPSGTQAISGNVGQSGTWSIRTLDGYGAPLLALNTNPLGSEDGLVVRNIPSGTQTINGTVNAAQSGTWIIRNQDGYGAPLLVLNTAPTGTENGLVVRNIPSGTQVVSGTIAATQSGTWIVKTQDGYGAPLLALNTNPLGTEDGLVVRNIPSGIQSISGNIGQSGTWSIRTLDGYGAPLLALNTAPLGTEDGLVVRNIPSGNQTVVQSSAFNLQAAVLGFYTDNSTNSTTKIANLPARANTVAPTWTDGYQVPLSVDTSANLRTTNASIGTNGATAPASSTQIGGFDGTNIVQIKSSVPSYMASTNGLVATGTTAGTVTSLAYYFHTAAVTKRAEIYRIEISYATFTNVGSSGSITFRGARITAENATPGGTTETINPMDTADAAGTGTFRVGATGAPTRSTGDLFSYATSTGAQAGLIVWESKDAGKPIVMRAGVAEGFEIRTVVATTLTTAIQVSVNFYWTER